MSGVKLSDFDYNLPEKLIAQYPLKERSKCRLMVLDRERGSIEHKIFEDIVDHFNKDDLLVLNDTRVIPARLFGRRATGGKVEIFLLETGLRHTGCGKPSTPGVEGGKIEALVRPSGRLKEGEKITLESGAEARVLERGKVGRFVRFNRPVEEILRSGHVPLPPYIGRIDEARDKEDYQTVYAAKDGATASPTAGLHFTKELLSTVSARGTRVTHVTLHTSYGTFAPVKDDEVEKHKMHEEYFELPVDTIESIRETKQSGGKIFAVGTTSTRVLEYNSIFFRTTNDERRTTSGYTDMYIYPGYKFNVVDRLITNFHLPKSTLMLLVCAFAGRELIFEAYRQAIKEKYRFFSYGDAMLIL
jgi:S-adenosylmethionine:tRNA ribosyltransferase-isomerase